MPEMNGFSMAHEIGPEQMPALVFLSAPDQYAIRAFEINAIDYLLKPVTVDRFVQSLARAKARLRTGKTSFIGVQDVDWIRAAENYVELHVAQANNLLHVTMNTLEKSPDPETFLRIHRSLIVNLHWVREIQPAGY
jgi:two-component system, LytTR family, response regulator